MLLPFKNQLIPSSTKALRQSNRSINTYTAKAKKEINSNNVFHTTKRLFGKIVFT